MGYPGLQPPLRPLASPLARYIDDAPVVFNLMLRSLCFPLRASEGGSMEKIVSVDFFPHPTDDLQQQYSPSPPGPDR